MVKGLISLYDNAINLKNEELKSVRSEDQIIRLIREIKALENNKREYLRY